MNFSLNKGIKAYTQLFSGILTLILGIMFFVNYNYVWSKIISITILLLVLYTVVHIVEIDSENRKVRISMSIDVIISIGALILINLYSNYYVALFPIVVGVYLLLISLTRFVRAYVYFTDKLKYKYFVLIDAIVSLIFALALLNKPLANINYFSYYIGTYFIFYGSSFIMQGFTRLFLASDAQFSMPVPVFIGAFLPGNTLERITEITDVETEDKPSDLEVFIYLREGGMGQFGHMDFSYKGKTYSYGCFDHHTQKLGGGYGDGVLIIADRDKFLKHGNVFKQASVIKYGLKLNDTQKALIDARIQELLDRAYRYESDSERDEKNGELKDKYDTYLANVYLNTHAETYKFKYGRFKTFFILSTNCVNVASYILRMKNLEVINMKGLITPGTYLNYLNNEYLNNSKVVVSRYVYEKDKI